MGCGGGGRWVFGRASGGAGGPERLHPPALVEVVIRHGFRLGGIELGGLVEVAGEGFLRDRFCFYCAGAHLEFGLGRPPGRMDKRG